VVLEKPAEENNSQNVNLNPIIRKHCLRIFAGTNTIWEGTKMMPLLFILVLLPIIFSLFKKYNYALVTTALFVAVWYAYFAPELHLLKLIDIQL
jgi:hypothetical protein